MKLLLKLARGDLRRNKTITAVLTAFLLLAACFMACGLRTAAIMASSLGALNAAALPPDYTQMHKGEYDAAQMGKFVAEHDYIADFQSAAMLDVRNKSLSFSKKSGEPDISLESSLMDNGFVAQNAAFDLLISESGSIASVNSGEVGVPVYYAEELGVEIGDTLTLRDGGFEKRFTVSQIIRDCMMNVALTSSKRLLVCRSDLDELSASTGEWEYCLEFRLKDGGDVSRLAEDYINAGMPANGVAVPAAAISMINSVSYGMTALVIIAISLLLVCVSLLCLSFIIRATLENERRTIGEMKAIGLPNGDIKSIYRVKYVVLIIIASVAGYFAAIPLSDLFAASIVRYCGRGESTLMQWLLPAIGLALLCLIVSGRCGGLVKKTLKSSVAELTRGMGAGKKEGRYALPRGGMGHKNITMALGELKCKWKSYIVLCAVFALGGFLMILPANMLNTVGDPSFITYMGVGECDIRVDLQYSEDLQGQLALAQEYLEKSPDIARFGVYSVGSAAFENADGETEYIRVQNGDESLFPLDYVHGRAPEGRGEIALSFSNAKNLAKTVGNSVCAVYDGAEYPLVVSGIYQDITYSGNTSKAHIDFAPEDIEVYLIYVNVANGVSAESAAKSLRAAVPGARVTPVKTFVRQTLGGIVESMELVRYAAAALSLSLCALIAVMFLRLIIARERGELAVKKAIGFSRADIKTQLCVRVLAVQAISIIIGTALANTLGESLFSLMLSAIGASRIRLVIDPISSFLLCPLAQLAAVTIAAAIASGAADGAHIRDQVEE